MKKMYLSLSACALISSLTLVGCGSSNDSSTSNNSKVNTGTLQLNPYLENINYECGDETGLTNNLGEYKYKENTSECKFLIGGNELVGAPSTVLKIEDLAEQNDGVSSEVLSAYIIAKMSEKTGKNYDINNLPDSFELPEDIKGDKSEKLDFSSFDKLKEKISDEKILEKVEKIKYDVAKRFAKKVSIKFEEIATPTTDETKNTQQVSPKIMVNDEEQTISFKTILSTGDKDNNEIFGLVKDFNDKSITFKDGSPYICNGTNSGVGSGLDYSSFLNVDDKLYMVSQFECQIGAMYMTELNQDSKTGKLTPKSGTLKFISQKDEFGGFVHCAGQKTPWESHLGSEEYENNARAVENYANKDTGFTGNKYYDETAKFWDNDATLMSPYYYGWSPEVKIEKGEPVYTKHYAMGRFSHELSYVMPDNKTVYMSDDGTNVGLFMFVADKQKDLSSGTLYAAKWKQTSKVGVGAGEADITWINLGHATNSEIRKYLDKDNNVKTNDALKFSDIFDSVDGDNGTCPSGFTSINTSAYHECLKIKEGMELAASRLETRRYAALMGATTEFRKEEGITFDALSGKLYVAMSSVERGMEDNQKSGKDNTKYDIGGNNDIKVEYNKCGAVYALDISTSNAKDSKDKDISSKFVVENMYSIIEGTPMSYSEDSIYAKNSCDVNGISNPDNITFLPNSDILTIGEDTGKHENNVVWAYNVKTKELTRTFTTPIDAETTSPFWYSNLANGYGYLSVVTQHPKKYQDNVESSEKQSSIGYVGPFKNLTKLKTSSDEINSIVKIATYKTDTEGASEIVAYDKELKKAFTTNGAENKIDILKLKSENGKTTLEKEDSIDLSMYGKSVQSVAVNNGKIAVAVGSVDNATTKGNIVVFDTKGNHLKTIEAGYLPDMVTFNEDGSLILVANEGEPNSDYSIDPKGSIGVIDIKKEYEYTDLTFDKVTVLDEVIIKDGSKAAVDLEPEYITVSENKAYVTLQENNAIAIVDLEKKEISSVVSLGFKDHSKKENSIDIEEEGEVLLKTYNSLYGMYMPDSISSYKIGSKTYLVTANEGDGREYGDYENETKIKKLDLVDNLVDIYANENDLKIHNELGKNSEGKYEKLYTFGARSFSIWDEEGNLVFDSANELSKLTSKFMPKLFNQDDGEIDGRSGNKGVEPEALTVGEVNGRTYAFVGLERQNAIVVYDITNPSKAKFVKYIITQNDGDISPEGMKFVKAEDSLTGNALLLVAYEMSGSTSIYEIK